MPFRQSIICNIFQNRAAPSRKGSLFMDRIHPFDTVFLKMINIAGKAIVLSGAVHGGTEPVVITNQKSPTGCLNAPAGIAGCRLHIRKAATDKSVIET
jgi:hypothetical protein